FESTWAVRRTTGMPCPTWGFTRSFAALAHGHGGMVWRECPGAIPVFIVLAAITLALVAGLISGRRITPGPRWTGRGRPWAWVCVAAIALLLANWIYRLRHGFV
ncbi:MAG: DUF2752 domain-containing protein, partial [Kiritimatiellae bacterium]|nr:DUF2752 domain-containing protein [Kiritimatiellia bacterium]